MVDAGERLGPFLLLERIGRGGMGEVWLAQALGLPASEAPGSGLTATQTDLCVVKTVRAEQADDADAVKRFADESRLAMLVTGPHIARVVDAGRAGDVRYLALALVEGVDLLTLMNRLPSIGRNLDDAVALWIGACLLDALASAHTARHPLTQAPLGVVHRDISPHNVMCVRNGEACVIDFGLALSSVKQARTEQNVVFGKLAYMAPEQARGAVVDSRADIFAAGVVLYELLSGQRYWGALTTSEIWGRVGGDGWVPPHWQTLAPDLQGFLAPMLASERRLRSFDAAERLAALTPLLMARGGSIAAAQQLANIVQEVAEPELARADRARAAMVPVATTTTAGAAQQDPATLALQLPPDTISFAIEEAVAVAAALATRTVALPAFADLVAASTHIESLPAWARTEMAIPAAQGVPPAATLPSSSFSSLPSSFSSSSSLGTVVLPHAAVAPSRSSSPSSSRRLLLAGGVVVVAIVAIVGALAMTGTPAPTMVQRPVIAPVITPVVTPVIAPVIAPVITPAAPPTVAVVAGAVVVDAGQAADVGAGPAVPRPPPPSPVRRSLDQRLQALSSCRAACVGLLQKKAPLPPAAEPLLVGCERTCRQLH